MADELVRLGQAIRRLRIPEAARGSDSNGVDAARAGSSPRV